MYVVCNVCMYVFMYVCTVQEVEVKYSTYTHEVTPSFINLPVCILDDFYNNLGWYPVPYLPRATSLAIYLMSIVNINSLAFHGIGPLPCPENHVLLSYSARSYRGHRNGSYCIIFSLLVLLLSLFIENFKNFILYCVLFERWYFSD